MQIVVVFALAFLCHGVCARNRDWHGVPLQQSRDVGADPESIYGELDEAVAVELEGVGPLNDDADDPRMDVAATGKQSGNDEQTDETRMNVEERSVESQTEVESLKSLVDQLQKTVESMSQQIDALIKQDVVTLRLINSKTDNRARRIGTHSASSDQSTSVITTGGTHYVRWGRSDCPAGVKRLYKGYMGGTFYSSTTGSGNIMCLHDSPQWGQTGFYGSGSAVHGAEYEFDSTPFSTANNNGQKLKEFDIPCSVCHTPLRSNKIMIPGRLQCPAGWTFEYTGYIVSSYTSYSKTDFQCLDSVPGSRVGGHHNDNGAVLRPVHTTCGSLPCPPYVASRNIVCVVCTK